MAGCVVHSKVILPVRLYWRGGGRRGPKANHKRNSAQGLQG